MAIMKITNRFSGATIYEAKAPNILELLYLAIKDSANLTWANLIGANLNGANLDGANLNGASLDRARLNGASLHGASLTWANLTWANLNGANLNGANLTWASLNGANLIGANLDGATVIETGETWEKYLTEVVPALLMAGGRAFAEVLTPAHWDCHSWDNCPLAAAFATKKISGVPLLLKPRAEQFIRYFDAKLIRLEAVGKKAA